MNAKDAVASNTFVKGDEHVTGLTPVRSPGVTDNEVVCVFITAVDVGAIAND